METYFDKYMCSDDHKKAEKIRHQKLLRKWKNQYEGNVLKLSSKPRTRCKGSKGYSNKVLRSIKDNIGCIRSVNLEALTLYQRQPKKVTSSDGKLSISNGR